MSERKQIGEFAAVVGISTAEQYEQLVSRLADVDRPMGSLAVGILMNEKTGLLGVRNSHGPSVYPLFDQVEAIADASVRTPGLELIIHYNTDHNDVVAGQLIRALGPIAECVNGVQINGLEFSDTPQLERLKEKFPHLAIIMQINRRLLARYEAAGLAEAVGTSKFIDGVWLDPSGGEDIELNPEALLPHMHAIAEDTDASIGMGGGLNPQTLRRLVGPVLAELPHVSWDGQTGVQTTVEGTKQFDTDKGYDFLAISADLRRKHPTTEFQQ